MKIGIWLSTTPGFGGLHQYELTMLEAIKKIQGYRVAFLASKDVHYPPKRSFHWIKAYQHPQSVDYYIRSGLSIIANYCLTYFTKILFAMGAMGLLKTLVHISLINEIDVVEHEKLDILVLPMSSRMSIAISGPKIVVSIHDLQHKLLPQFLEASGNGSFESRELIYQTLSHTASAILVDSEIGKEDVLHCYPQTDPARVIPLPFLPPSYLTPKLTPEVINQTRRSYHLPHQYLYYPANWWPHKNHPRLIKAISALHHKGIKLHLVLTGNKDVSYSTYAAVMAYAASHQLLPYIHFLGYVNNSTVSVLYHQAFALVMPTFFGPTNIPVLEAWVMGTPVITSDIRGCREQVGSAAILVDPSSVTSIATGIESLVTNSSLRTVLKHRGHARLKLWTKSQFTSRLNQVLEDICLP